MAAIQISTSGQGSTSGPALDLFASGARSLYLEIGVPLYKAALKGDWVAADVIIQRHPSVVRSFITLGEETALHIAATTRQTHFVEKLVNLMNSDDLELANKKGNTAFCFASASGIVQIAEVILKKNKGLLMIRNSEKKTPLHMAALLGHGEMVWYLYNKTKVHRDFTDTDRIGILNNCITTDLYDVALDMLKVDGSLAMARDGNGETALHVLARKPNAFSGQSQLGMWTRIKGLFPGNRTRHNENSKQTQAVELVRSLWENVLNHDDTEISDLIRSPSRLVFVAAELGNTKFLIELISAYPDLIWKTNSHNWSVFHFAVFHRHESIYNLLYEIESTKDFITIFEDNRNGNTMLHLAAMLPSHNQLNAVSGAALQMQRELIWFKEVEKMMVPSYREKKNRNGETPKAMFTNEHKTLVKQGEDWMKHTASHCMLVATLITTVVFAAAFTVPGGNNDKTGTPMFLKEASFTVFAISDAVALFSSSTSILMFLAILTSRYAEDDFLESLPFKLMIGLGTLFVSIIAMMVAYSATFFIVYHHNLKWVPIPISVLALVPILLFATLQYPLLADMVQSTYGSRNLFRPSKNVLY